MALHNDPVGTRRTAEPEHRRSNTGRTLLIILLVVVVLAAIAWAAGLFNVQAEGELRAPDVDVSATGGEVPDVDVQAADIDVGTTTETIEVPTVEVTKPGEQPDQ